jgi:hypothetical protein
MGQMSPGFIALHCTHNAFATHLQRIFRPDMNSSGDPFEIRSIGEPDPLARPHSWLWDGYLMRGGITVLTSQWKSGKTTLVSLLLSRLGAGGTFAGRPIQPGRAAVVSEEAMPLWEGRHARQPIPQGTAFYRPQCPYRTTPEDWEWLTLRLALGGYDLVVIDPLAAFLPGRPENNAAALLEALTPLRDVANGGAAVLILHHPRKGISSAGQAARGSGALAGMADILIEMDWFGRATSDDRRRTLLGFSRYPETPRRLVIELTADGTDYVSHGDLRTVDGIEGWPVLAAVLAGADRPLTRDEILSAWPAGESPPESTVLWRRLDRAVQAGAVTCSGSGRRNAPFVYWLSNGGLNPGAA